MSTLPTPRTDAWLKEPDQRTTTSALNLARQLERELTEAKAERDALKAEIAPLREIVGVRCDAESNPSDITNWMNLVSHADAAKRVKSDLSRWRALAEELAGALETFANLDVEHMVNQRKPHAHPVFGLNSTLFVLGDVLNARQLLAHFRDAANPASARTPKEEAP